MKAPFYYSTFSMIVMTMFTSMSCHKTGLPDTQSGDWIQAASIGGFPRAYGSSFVIGDTAYVGLGLDEANGPSGYLTDFWSFNLNRGWRQETDFPGKGRSNAVGFNIGDTGYVGTGVNALNNYDDFYMYDPASHQWTPRASFKGGVRYDAVGFGLQGKGYIGTGYNNYWLNDFYEYDPATDSWTQTVGTVGDFSKRQGASAFVYKNKAYIVGGGVSGAMARDFWSFDPSQPAPWKQLANITNTDPGSFDDGYMDIERMNASAFVNGDKAYLTLGKNGVSGTAVTSTWMYDFAQGIWARRTPYPRAPRFGAVAFTIGGESFVGAGSTGNGASFDDFNIFAPDKAYNVND